MVWNPWLRTGGPRRSKPANGEEAVGSIGRRGSPWRFGVLLGVVALAGFLGRAVVAPCLPLQDDAFRYHEGAVSILRGDGYVRHTGARGPGGDSVVYAYRPPGTSMLLACLYAVTGPHQIWSPVAMAVFTAAAVVVAYALFRQLTGEGQARLGAVVFMLLAHTTRMSESGYSESLFIFLLLLSLWLAIAKRSLGYSVLSGLVLGMAYLVRANAVPFVFALFVVLVLLRLPWRAALGKAALIFAVSLLVVLPWSLRNWRTLGRFVLISTNGGTNLYVGNNPRSTGGYWWVAPVPAELAAARNEVELDRLARQKAVAFILAHPGLFARRTIDKLSHTCGFAVARIAWLKWLLSLATAAWLAIAGVQGAWALARVIRMRNLEFGWALVSPVIVAYFLSFPLVFFGMRRFIYPAYPFLALSMVTLGAWAVCLFDRARSGHAQVRTAVPGESAPSEEGMT